MHKKTSHKQQLAAFSAELSPENVVVAACSCVLDSKAAVDPLATLSRHRLQMKSFRSSLVLAALGCVASAAVVQLTPSVEDVAPAQVPDAATAASSQASSPIRIPFPPTIRRVWLNIGSHIDPPVSPNEDTMTIAVEPVLSIAANITKHPRLLVLPCAISDRVGIAPFYAYNDGLSSSLNLANEAAPDLMGWKSKALPSDIPSVALVPVVTLRHLLDAIPRHIEIELIKTDMQGHDLAAIKSAGLAARRAKFIHHEASCDNRTSYAGAPQNDAELDWIAYMVRRHRFHTMSSASLVAWRFRWSGRSQVLQLEAAELPLSSCDRAPHFPLMSPCLCLLLQINMLRVYRPIFLHGNVSRCVVFTV